MVLMHHSKGVLKGSLVFMQHFKLENSFFDVTNRLIMYSAKEMFKIGPKWILTENYRVAERNYLRLLHTLKTTQCAL